MQRKILSFFQPRVHLHFELVSNSYKFDFHLIRLLYKYSLCTARISGVDLLLCFPAFISRLSFLTFSHMKHWVFYFTQVVVAVCIFKIIHIFYPASTTIFIYLKFMCFLASFRELRIDSEGGRGIKSPGRPWYSYEFKLYQPVTGIVEWKKAENYFSCFTIHCSVFIV